MKRLDELARTRREAAGDASSGGGGEDDDAEARARAAKRALGKCACLCFAAPSVCSLDLSLRARAHTVSVVAGKDVIPRLCYASVRRLLRRLNGVAPSQPVMRAISVALGGRDKNKDRTNEGFSDEPTPHEEGPRRAPDPTNASGRTADDSAAGLEDDGAVLGRRSIDAGSAHPAVESSDARAETPPAAASRLRRAGRRSGFNAGRGGALFAFEAGGRLGFAVPGRVGRSGGQLGFGAPRPLRERLFGPSRSRDPPPAPELLRRPDGGVSPPDGVHGEPHLDADDVGPRPHGVPVRRGRRHREARRARAGGGGAAAPGEGGGGDVRTGRVQRLRAGGGAGAREARRDPEAADGIGFRRANVSRVPGVIPNRTLARGRN